MIKNAFNHFDIDGTGFISQENLIEALQRTGRFLSKKKIHKMIDEVNIENKDVITFQEFQAMLTG